MMKPYPKTIATVLAVLLLCLGTALMSACDKAPDTDQQGPIPDGIEAPGTDATKQTTEQATEQTTEGKLSFTLPDFEVLDQKGNTVKLSDFYGKPVLLNFWATWCPSCKVEMPDLQKAYETYGEEICFVMVNLTDGSRDTVEGVKAFLADNGYTFPVYFDTQSLAAMAYGVRSIPTTYLISAEGKILGGKSGSLSVAEIEAAMAILTE